MNCVRALSFSALFASLLLLAGCDGRPAPSETADHGNDHGHSHDADGGEAHDDPARSHEEESHEEETHDAADARHLGTVSVNDTTVEVELMDGHLAPGVELHLDIHHTDGPAPRTVRLWVGDESATGTMKVRADGQGDHYHGHVPVPETLADDAALWVEIESAEGHRVANRIKVD